MYMDKFYSTVLDALLPKGKARQAIFFVLITVSAVLLSALLLINELSKKDIKQSQLQIEKNRISQIDKQLGTIYNRIYNSNDSIFAFNSRKYLEQAKFLKSQRIEAITNIDTVNNDPNGEIAIFGVVTSVLVLTLVVFFSISFKSDFNNSNVDEIVKRSKERLKILSIKAANFDHDERASENNYNFLDWMISEGIYGDDTGALNIDLVKSLKSIYDMSAGATNRNLLLKHIVSYGAIVKQQFNADSAANDTILYDFKDIKKRLLDECNRLNKQALLNLFICFIVAFLLIGYIAYNSMGYFDIKGIPNLHVFIIKYLPRLVSVIGLITVFLYFVKLYQANISNVKYYQNELTNVELKLVALHTSLVKGDFDSNVALSKAYALVERNAIVMPNVSNEINANIISSYADTIKDIFQKIVDISTSLKKVKNNDGEI